MATAGFDARVLALPRGSAERALPVYRAAVPSGPGAIIGGQSFGGRVASLLAAEDDGVAGLILMCYPLHPPGRPERAAERMAHWQRIHCPVLLLSGDRDPFARVELLRDAVRSLQRAELHVYAGVGHGLRSVMRDVTERAVDFARRLPPPVHSVQ